MEVRGGNSVLAGVGVTIKGLNREKKKFYVLIFNPMIRPIFIERVTFYVSSL